MARPTNTSEPLDPAQDPLLAAVPTIEGYKVLGKTILLEVIGHGGMGVVYRGWHMTFHIDVAVKVLRPALAADRDYVRRFRRESQAALKITHQNVVRAYDVEELHGLHYFVMEFVDGESAWQRVGRLGRLSPAAALTVFAAAATGLAEAHAHGLVHRDIKPSNLLIARSGRVKLADLGLVHPAMDSDDAAAGAGGDGSSRLLGTPQYLAPEQWESAPAQMSADVWALGATLYYLATGRHGLPRMPKAELRRWVREQPFPTLSGVLRTMPELNAIFERCVQHDPAARFQTAGELSQALLALGPGDEELLREGAPEVSLSGARLPPNEVLGRIDAQLRRGAPTSAAPSMARAKPSVGPVVVTPRRHVAAARQRSGSGGLIVVVVLAVIAIVASIVYLRSQGHRNDDAAAATRDGSVAGPESSAGTLGSAPPRDDTDAAARTAAMTRAPVAPPPANPAVSGANPIANAAATVRAEPVVEASAPAAAPAAMTLRDTLQAWLAHRGDGSQLEHLVRHRDTLLLECRHAAEADATTSPPPIEACLAAFDEPMRAFPEVEPGSVPESSVDQLLAVAGALRRQGASIEPLLPYLLLLQQNDADDPRVAFCLFEAWAVEALDLQGAREAAGVVQQQLSASAATSPLRTRLPEVAFEVGELGDDGMPMLARVVRALAGRAGGALGPFAVARAFVPELEAGYAKAMQAGDVDAVGRHLRALRTVDPADRAAEVLLAVATGRRDVVTFDHASLAAEEQAAVEARARHLGLGLIEAQLDVAGALQRLSDASTAQFAFFDTGLAAQAASKAEASDRINKEIPALRRAASALEAKAADQTQKSANLMQKNPVASEKARVEALRLTDEAKAVRAKIPSLEQTLQGLKKDVRRLTAEVESLRKLRAAFQLQ